MADSWQLAILKALTDHLKTIDGAPDWDFDFSTSVFRGRHVYGDTDPLPMISIVENPSTDIVINTAGENQIARSDVWVLLVQGWAKHQAENPTDELYNMKAAVEKKLSECIEIDPRNGDPMFPDVYMLGFHKKVITGITIGPGVVSVDLRQQPSNKAFFYLPVGIGLAANISEPFETP